MKGKVKISRCPLMVGSGRGRWFKPLIYGIKLKRTKDSDMYLLEGGGCLFVSAREPPTNSRPRLVLELTVFNNKESIAGLSLTDIWWLRSELRTGISYFL